MCVRVRLGGTLASHRTPHQPRTPRSISLWLHTPLTQRCDTHAMERSREKQPRSPRVCVRLFRAHRPAPRGGEDTHALREAARQRRISAGGDATGYNTQSKQDGVGTFGARAARSSCRVPREVVAVHRAERGTRTRRGVEALHSRQTLAGGRLMASSRPQSHTPHSLNLPQQVPHNLTPDHPCWTAH